LFGDDEYPDDPDDPNAFKTEMANRLVEWAQPLILCIVSQKSFVQQKIRFF
jgi:hypothetical protein